MQNVPFFQRLLRAINTGLRLSRRYFFGQFGERRVLGLQLYFRLRLLAIVRLKQFTRMVSRRNVKVYIDGKNAFARIERSIQTAVHSIIIQMFIWKDDPTGRRIAALIVQAANRGVMVTILKEAVGDFFEIDQDFFGTKESVHYPWKLFWNHPNITITYSAHNDHAKVMIIDDDVLLLTGMNIGTEYRYNWHDYLVELRGKSFVRQFLTHEQSESQDVELKVNRPPKYEIRTALRTIISQAKHSIIIEHCYISDPEVIQLLAKRSHQGIHISLIIPRTSDVYFHATQEAIGRLLIQGNSAYIRVFMYPKMLHAKVILVDFCHCFIGSANLMKSSLDDMGEVNVVLHGITKKAIRVIRESLRKDIASSTVLTSQIGFSLVSKLLAMIGL